MNREMLRIRSVELSLSINSPRPAEKVVSDAAVIYEYLILDNSKDEPKRTSGEQI